MEWDTDKIFEVFAPAVPVEGQPDSKRKLAEAYRDFALDRRLEGQPDEVFSGLAASFAATI